MTCVKCTYKELFENEVHVWGDSTQVIQREWRRSEIVQGLMNALRL